MTRETQSTVILVIGLIVGRLALQGGYTAYVKPGLYWPLLASAAVLVAVGAWSMWAARRTAAADGVAEVVDEDAHGHAGHDAHRERVGWLLLVPIAVLLLVAPAPLGAFAAQRGAANRTAQADASLFEALPPARDGAVDLTFQESIIRMFYDKEDTLAGTPIRLVGFAVPDDESGSRWRLTRFTVGCCAADASPLQVVVDDPEVPATDTWLEAVVTWGGTFVEDGNSRLPLMTLVSSREVPEPAEPYEY